MTYFILLAVVMWLAYGNGANDNFKGVATLYGSGTAGFRQALGWATITTLAGSIVSILLAERLVSVFSGSGLLPPELLGSGTALSIVGAAAAATIMLATILGMPTSTTHVLAGALLGIAWTTSSLSSPWPAFLKLFALPLLLSPFLAISLTAIAYPVLRRLRLLAGITRDSCVCVDEVPVVHATSPVSVALASVSMPQFQLGTIHECGERYEERIAGVDAQTAVNAVHYLSAGAVCFSRAVNDTPKIAALLLALNGHSTYAALACVAAAMAAGGVIQSRRVAETMSRRITDLNPGQGLCANLVTAGLVLFASRLGLPVSTTHVSCGAIFGIGLVQREARWKTIAAVAATWTTTLPLAAVLGACLYRMSISFAH
ncbi:MAG: inorganic phosphate transporter [Candidatus Hydrogenedentes bacterium]|nr:inorganic phosphate transporter [Candidatus Hydrogenedentota bacterium]